MAPATALLLLAKATLVLVAALALARGLQRAAAGARYLVWLAALGGLLLVPALALWGPLRVGVLPATPAPTSAPYRAPGAALGTPLGNTLGGPRAGAPGGVLGATRGAAGADPAASASPAGAGAAGVPDGASTSRGALAAVAGLGARGLLPLLAGVWALGALGLAAALGRSWLAVRRIVRRARPLDAPAWRDPLYEVADRLGLDEVPRLLRSEDVKMPFACGLARPTVVLPAEGDAWTPDRRRAVLLHELAHVRRRDLAGHTLARVVCAAYWFHPLVWTAARRLRAESERACDDLALTCGARAADYAEHLLDIVTSVRRDATPVTAMAMARRTEFEGRMLDILDGERRRATPTRRQGAALVGALAVLTVAVGAVAPVPAEPAARPAAVAAARGPAAVDGPASAGRGGVGARTQAPAALAEPRADAPTPNTPALPGATASGRPIAGAPNAMPNVVPNVVPAPAGLAFGAAPSVEPAPAAGGVRRFVSPDGAHVLTVDVGGIVATASAAASAAPDGAARAEVIRRLLRSSGTRGSAADDERPALLARVLRSDSSAELRRIAAWGLAEYADAPVAAAALAAALRGDRAAAVREMAAWALAEGEPNATARDALAAALRADAEPSVRATAAWALGSVGDRGAADALVAALGDASSRVRLPAAWALGNVEPREAPRALVALLADPEPRVREAAAWALFNIEDPAAAPALQAALRTEQDPRLQVAYIRALAAFGERSVDALRGLLESSDPRVKATAVRALAGGNAAGPWPWPWPQPRPSP